MEVLSMLLVTLYKTSSCFTSEVRLRMRKFDRMPGIIPGIIGPQADPSPEFKPFWEEFTRDQQKVILVKDIDIKIRDVEYNIESLKIELDRLENIKSMIKGLK